MARNINHLRYADVRRLIADLRASRQKIDEMETQLAACVDVILDMEGDLYAEPPNGTE